MTEAVECQNVSKFYGDAPAVHDASLTLAAGELLALLGPSGCGKTTTLRLIAGLERPDSGKILLDGRPVADGNLFVPPNHRGVGMVFQDYALFPHMTIEKNIAYGLSSNQSARVAEMLELVSLSGFEKRYPAELSGGQQQRVALARALAPQPQTILLDEPFSNLDTGLRAQVRHDVRRILDAAGVSAILVTHDQEEAMSMADRVAVMLAGRVQQIDTPRNLYDDAATPEVFLFLGDANRLLGEALGEVVDMPLGRLTLRHAQNGRVEVFIRPENLVIHPDEIPNARIEGIEFYGDRQAVHARLDANTSHMLELMCHAQDHYTVGQPVHIRVRGAVVAFPV
jgi:iron(III) transport system ATP-binding protein